MSLLIFAGLAGAISKLAGDFRDAISGFASELREQSSSALLGWAARALFFWLVLRVCCRAFFACALDACFPRRACWFCIGDSRTSANYARILSARSRRERFLLEQLYLARRVPCAEEFEAVCRSGRICGDPVIIVDFASRPGPTEPIHASEGVARIVFAREPRVVGAEVLEGTVPRPLRGVQPSAPPRLDNVFPFPFGAIDLAEIHSRIWPPAPRHSDGTDTADLIARARARRLKSPDNTYTAQ